PEVRQVFAEWKKRHERGKTVRYRATGEMIFPKGCYTTDPEGKVLATPVPSRDVACPKNYSFLLDFTTDRFRLEREEHFYRMQSDSIIRIGGVSAFDGKELQSMTPRERNSGRAADDPDVGIISGNLRGCGLISVSEYWPLFFAHGIIPTLTDHIL